MNYLDPTISTRRIQATLNSNKLQRKRFELAFSQTAKYNKAADKSNAIKAILHDITGGAADKYCGLCVHTRDRRNTAGCFDDEAKCWFPDQCIGVKETINEWVVASAIRRGHKTAGEPMDTTLCELLGTSRFALLGLAPTTLCTRSFMQRAAQTIEEEFALSTGSLQIFDKDFQLFRAGQTNELQKAPQRFARLIKKWNVHHELVAQTRNKGKSKQSSSALSSGKPQRRVHKAGSASRSEITSPTSRAKRAKQGETHHTSSTLSPAAAYNCEQLLAKLREFKTFWEGLSTDIDQDRDLAILQDQQHNGIFFASTDATTLGNHGYGKRFVQNILFFMQKEGFITINDAELK